MSFMGLALVMMLTGLLPARRQGEKLEKRAAQLSAQLVKAVLLPETHSQILA